MASTQTGKRWKTSLGWITILEDQCKGCNYCIEFCPVEALKVSVEFNRHGYYYPVIQTPGECVNCGYCQLLCPDFSIWSEKEVELG